MVFGIPNWVWLADIAMAVVAGSVAQARGYSFRAYFILSLFLPVIGLVVALTRPEDDASASKADANRGTTDADELRKWKQLLDDGAITQEEYDHKKADLLG